MDTKTPSKPPVVRGARACQVCRAAKMKCVGAEDNGGTCQRCARSGAKCIFEKHRRGRKPGSKLSASSKLLREMEKGLRNAKKSQVDDPLVLPRLASYEYDTHFPANQLPPLNLSEYPGTTARSIEVDDDDEEHNGEALFPAKMITKEKRNSYFKTILNDHEDAPNNRVSCGSPARAGVPSTPIDDPISTGIITDDDARVLFDFIFLRLNPFINLFDPALHTVNYVRSKCPFLFTVLIMAGAKFFRPELFKRCQKLANDLRIRAFAEGWKSVEVVQAFACLTYWKEPDDNCTWTYIGYAARMAVELGLNRYISHPPHHENDFQLRERRNRERTYLVLFVHDRSLSTQTGRNWMLPEDEIVQHSNSWHEDGGAGTIRPEDVILAAFVQLRRIAAETTDVFHTANRAMRNGSHIDVNYEVVLRNCNSKLTHWMDHWKREMQRAGGSAFHISFLSYWRLYVRLFLNSFGIQNSISSTSNTNPSVQALSVCYTSAIDSLKIVAKDFASLNLLRYCQESIIVMSAYSAVFLLKLLRSSSTLPQLHESAAQEIHAAITQTADAFHEAASLSPASESAAAHSRFLRNLVANNDIFKRGFEKSRYDVTVPQIDPRLQGPSPHSSSPSSTQGYSHGSSPPGQSFHFPASPHLPAHPLPRENDTYAPEIRSNTDQLTSPIHGPNTMNADLDAQYWRNMFLGLGFGSIEPSPQPVPGGAAITSGEGFSSYHHMHSSTY